MPWPEHLWWCVLCIPIITDWLSIHLCSQCEPGVNSWLHWNQWKIPCCHCITLHHKLILCPVCIELDPFHIIEHCNVCDKYLSQIQKVDPLFNFYPDTMHNLSLSSFFLSLSFIVPRVVPQDSLLSTCFLQFFVVSCGISTLHLMVGMLPSTTCLPIPGHRCQTQKLLSEPSGCSQAHWSW